MARLQRFSGVQALPGVGSPQVVADTAVGDATVRLGPQIGRSAAALGDLAEVAIRHHAKEKDEADGERKAARANDLSNRKQAFAGYKAAEDYQQQVQDRLAAPRSLSSGTPVALSDELVEFMTLNKAKIMNGMPEEQKASFDVATERAEDQLRTDIAFAEDRQDKVYYLKGIDETRELAVDTVSRSPEKIDQVFDDFVDLVATAALPQSVRERALEDAGRDLLEAWVQAHPPDVQIAGLSDLQVRKRDDANPAAFQDHPVSEFAVRAGALPEDSRYRLLATALKIKTESALVEQADIVERIDSEHGQVDPLAFSGNTSLNAETRVRLLSRYLDAEDTRSRNVSAVEWLAAADMSDPFLASVRGLANDAFAFLNDDNTDSARVIRGIAIAKGMLPRNAAKVLIGNLTGDNSKEVSQAFNTLSVLGTDALQDSVAGADGRQLRTLLAGQTFLTADHGLTGKTTAELFAKANETPTRKERLENFASLYSVRRGGAKTFFPILD